MRGGEALGEEPILAAAVTHGKTAAQVVLRWHMQLGNVDDPEIRDTRLALRRTSISSTSS